MKKQQEVKNTDELSQQATSRSNCYGLLALVLRDVPTSEIISQLKTGSLAEALSHLGFDVTEELTGELEEVTQSLAGQYTETFIGPGPHVPLYASVHMEDEGQLWGDSTVWLKRFVETTGLSFNDHWDSIPDHITIELELMQRLAAHEASLWGKKNSGEQLSRCLKAQEQLLRDHLCKWVPRFCDRVLKVTASSFYQKMAELTKSVILSDIDQITATQQSL